jgi:pimeloyl-ACP methyl ester carboxylesterase
MRPTRRIVAFSLLTLFAAAFAVAAPDDKGPEDVAREFVTLLSEEKFAEAVKLYDETMSKALPADGLAETWKRMLWSTGVFEKQIGVRTERVQVYEAVFVTCKFERAYIDIRVVLDRDLRVSGLFFLPGSPPGEKIATAGYTRPDGIREMEVTVGTGEWALPGTLTLPKGDGPFAAAVLVHGSGPNDRDESVGSNKPFRDLAWGLAARGVAVLRYDKRSLVHGEKMVEVTDLTVQGEVIDDVLAAVALLRGTETIRPDLIFVVGHSLGGMLVPRIAEQESEVAGFVILAGPTRPLGVLLLEQLEYIHALDGEISDEENRLFEEMATAVARIRALESADAAEGMILGAPAAYWIDLRG